MGSQIFVFGANLAGRHGKGAALCALREHGAKYGVGHGPQGSSYAIPTKDERLRPLPLTAIRGYAAQFLDFARRRPLREFRVTRVGCGLAGYKDHEIAPMFVGAPSNCRFDEAWRPYLEGSGQWTEL